ncbi:MAG TPA: hypothetical protein VFE25_06275 [Opitutaceae bacterium]|jgi:hypothetical protein|nr:hypothetical protein [Opitutaceae bacterium]
MNPRILLSLVLAAAPLASRGAIAVLGTLAQEQSVAPGESFEGTIVLQNTGTETETARISQTDYAFAADGSNNFASPGSLPHSNAPWISVGTTLVRIPGGESATVPYHGKVPADPSLKGSYWSIIMVEDSTPLEIGNPANGIKTLARYGIQVISDIGESGRRSVKFARHDFVQGKAATVAFLDLVNDGERLIFPKLWIEVYDASGSKLGRFGGEAVRLYPDCSTRYRVELPGLPKGAYNALMLVDCGHDQMVGTRISFAL